MTTKDFDRLFDKFVQIQKDKIAEKKGEYVRNDDRLWNFKRSGASQNCTPERALQGMADKHHISILDIIQDVEDGKIVKLALIDEKLVDYGNYILLLYALLNERFGDKLLPAISGKNRHQKNQIDLIEIRQD